MALGIRKNKILSLFKPFEQTFNYTGNVQTLTIPYNGLYKLEVYGARGNYVNAYSGKTGTAGKGGKSIGYKWLTKGTVLYIVCGNGGGSSKSAMYNGGGTGVEGGAGGGATHIALVTGTIADIGKTTFDQQGLIVAGGGGGGISSPHYTLGGGSGGGTNGGNATVYSGAGLTFKGATQTQGGSIYYSNGTEASASYRGSFGKGANTSGVGGCGGGGGYFGGCSGNNYNGGWPGSGGSGWIGGVPTITYKDITYSPSTSNGVNSGSGYAIITRIA